MIKKFIAFVATLVVIGIIVAVKFIDVNNIPVWKEFNYQSHKLKEVGYSIKKPVLWREATEDEQMEVGALSGVESFTGDNAVLFMVMPKKDLKRGGIGSLKSFSRKLIEEYKGDSKDEYSIDKGPKKKEINGRKGFFYIVDCSLEGEDVRGYHVFLEDKNNYIAALAVAQPSAFERDKSTLGQVLNSFR